MAEEKSEAEIGFEAILKDVLDRVKSCAFCQLHATEPIGIPVFYAEAMEAILESVGLKFICLLPIEGETPKNIQFVVYTTGVRTDKPMDPKQE